jgi:hypothetical protein
MTKEFIELYKTLFFTLPSTTPTLKTYAIVDSARDDKLIEKLVFSNLNSIDLWHEDFWELEQSRPLYLVELEEENVFLDYLLSQREQSVATYFISPYSLETLQAYYNKFTYVTIEEEPNRFEKVLFGFYDPNVLAEYIQTLYNQEKIDEFFAGVAMWLMPSLEKEDELYIAFRTKDGEVDDVNLQLSNIIKEENPSLNFDDVSLPTLANLEEHTHEVTIDYTQMQIFDEEEKTKFIEDVFEKLKKDIYTFNHSEESSKEKAFSFLSIAKTLGIESREGIYDFIVYGLLSPVPIQETQVYHKLRELPNEESKKDLLSLEIWNIMQYRKEMNNG